MLTKFRLLKLLFLLFCSVSFIGCKAKSGEEEYTGPLKFIQYNDSISKERPDFIAFSPDEDGSYYYAGGYEMTPEQALAE